MKSLLLCLEELDEVPQQQVHRLVLGFSDAREIPSAIQPWNYVPELYIARCPQLLRLPPELQNFDRLQKLKLSCPQLTNLPSWIGNWKQLRELDLHGCHRLSRLPPELQGLDQLIHMNLMETGVEDWEELIATRFPPRLQVLQLGGRIPESADQATQLLKQNPYLIRLGPKKYRSFGMSDALARNRFRPMLNGEFSFESRHLPLLLHQANQLLQGPSHQAAVIFTLVTHQPWWQDGN